MKLVPRVPLTHTINDVWVFVTVDRYGNEAVAGFLDMTTRRLTQLIATDRVTLDRMVPKARHVSSLAGMPVKLVHFTRAGVESEITEAKILPLAVALPRVRR